MLDFEAEFAAFLNRDLPDIETRFDTNNSLLSLTVTKNLNQDFFIESIFKSYFYENIQNTSPKIRLCKKLYFM